MTPAGPGAKVALLGGLFDHAPLFPPASLSVPVALDEDRRAKTSPWHLLLGRFVCPATLVDDLGAPGRALSVVLDGPLPDDPRIEAIEVRQPDDPASLVGNAAEVYVELPLDAALESGVAELARLGLSAKVRCGGETTPSSAELAPFVRACRELGLAFKATAGLHHAVRTAGEHGFLNLLAAAVFGDEEEALDDDDPAAFAVDDEAFAWRDREAGAAHVDLVRRGLLRSIGSCSFFEPVAELEALGITPP